MRVLLDTNIIIHRESSNVVRHDIGSLFNWLDKLKFTKCVHPFTLDEIKKHKDSKVVDTMSIKLESYHQLKTVAPLNENVKRISNLVDSGENDVIDTHLLNEVYCGRVNYLISEDKKLHSKAAQLNISDKVFRIITFIAKMLSEDITLVDYEVLSVKKDFFGNINLADSFFETFRNDYPGFDNWFNSKCDDEAYVSMFGDEVGAFLFLKTENENENYNDISPALLPKKRLKIGTFKVATNGIRLGERFLKIIFDNARLQSVSEIYVTIFNNRPELIQLINLLEEWGFYHHGTKASKAGTEQVYVRNFDSSFNYDKPKFTYPNLGAKDASKANKIFVVPIYPEYHTKLFPDSILKNEKKIEFDDTKPYRHSISKSYVSHSYERDLKPGDIIVFYRTGDHQPKYHTSVLTTIGIVENIYDNLQSIEELKAACTKRTVLTDEELVSSWNRYPKLKPFVVNFLYAYSFKRRPNLKALIEDLKIFNGISDVPRGFKEIGWENFRKLVIFAGI